MLRLKCFVETFLLVDKVLKLHENLISYVYKIEKEALSSEEFLSRKSEILCPQKIPGCTPFSNNLRTPVTWKIVIIFQIRKA